MVPDSLREFIKGIQEGLGIHRVIAVPFFLETRHEDGKSSKELIGNLFAASRSHEIQSWEIDILNAFGQQAAAGLNNVKLYQRSQRLYEELGKQHQETQRLYEELEKQHQETQRLYLETQELYKKAEDRRRAAEIFGKMAFSASASVHALRNQLTSVKLTLQTLEALGKVSREVRDSILDQIISSNQIPNVLNRLEDMKNLIESLHEPWRPINDTIVNVNTSIKLALDKTVGSTSPCVKLSLAQEELNVKTTPEMLLEFFKVLIKNAVEAMPDESERCLEITSQLDTNSVKVFVSDHGSGMDQETLGKIFDMRFTTKDKGLGFGLFWAKDYVEGLGGEIDVDSVIDQGTTFTIRLPKSDSLG
jgi:signal transduction histidine kinase